MFAHAIVLKKTSTLSDGGFEASTRIELVIEVLQTFALPLGYDALFYK